MNENDLLVQLVKQQGAEMRQGFDRLHEALALHAKDDSDTFHAHNLRMNGHGTKLAELNVTVEKARTLSSVAAWVGGTLTAVVVAILSAIGVNYVRK